MFITRDKIIIPAPTVLQEAASRFGYPNSASLSPYKGLKGDFNKWLSQSREGFDGNIEDMLKDVPDFDFDKIKPYEGPVKDDVSDKQIRRNMEEFRYSDNEEPSYVRRFEDMDGEFLRKYAYQIWYRLNNYNKGGILEYERNNQVTGVYIDEEDGVVEEKELITDTDQEESDEFIKQEAWEELPALIKKIHERSKLDGISWVSLARAFAIAGDILRETKGRYVNKKDINPRDILNSKVLPDYPVFHMNKDGELGKKCDYDANKNDSVFYNARKVYARGEDVICTLLNQFIVYLEAIGCNIRTENPKQYTEQNINKLVFTSVLKNKEYMVRKNHGNYSYGGVQFKDVIEKLDDDMPLEFYEEYDKVNVYTVEETIINSMSIFLYANNISEEQKSVYGNVTEDEQKNMEDNVREFLQYYNILHNSVGKHKFDDYLLSDNFLIEEDGVPAVFDMLGFLDSVPDSDMLAYHDALITMEGYLVLHIAQGDQTYCCEVQKASYALRRRYEGYEYQPDWRLIVK